MNKLAGKVAIVTGASKGIGAGIAKALAAEGAAVAVNYASSRTGADEVVAGIVAGGGKAIAIKADLAKDGEAQVLVEATLKAFGRLDILVNNAGVYAFAPLEDITSENFHHMFDINVLGLLLATRAAAPHLGEGASIINISSSVTSLAPPQSAVYTGTKAAVDAITAVLAKELAPRGIRVNAINPGIVETEGTRSVGIIGSDMERSLVAMTPLGRTGRPDDIARVAVFLASGDAGWLTGEHIVASGGLR